MIGTIAGFIFLIIIIAACCASDSRSSNSYTPPKRSTTRNTSYRNHSYSECPSCGAPYYDGYCDECGYPDVNQGWLGEEYG